MINDIMISNSRSAVTNDYLTNIAFQIFILVQAILLIKRWVDNYNERIALNNEIAFINKNLEKMVDDRTEELQVKNTELESSLKFKNQILSIIAHDLKNPVSSLAQFSDLLLSDIKVEKNSEILHSLQQSSYAAVNLIDNLLYWGRNQSEEISYLPEKTDMEVVIRDVLSLYKHMIQKKEISIINKIPAKTFAESDKALSNIVIRNILSNAIKFTPRNGTITISSELSEGQVKIFFKDSGVGIPKEKLDLFVKEGYLKSTAGTESEKGTGLGLQLVRDLININRGELHIESESGIGTCIWLTLPETSG
jgi:signal transduction histidine kinase